LRSLKVVVLEAPVAERAQGRLGQGRQARAVAAAVSALRRPRAALLLGAVQPRELSAAALLPVLSAVERRRTMLPRTVPLHRDLRHPPPVRQPGQQIRRQLAASSAAPPGLEIPVPVRLRQRRRQLPGRRLRPWRLKQCKVSPNNLPVHRPAWLNPPPMALRRKLFGQSRAARPRTKLMGRRLASGYPTNDEVLQSRRSIAKNFANLRQPSFCVELV
jgi:hypothetical protein